MKIRMMAAAVACLLGSWSTVEAQQVRYYEEDGVTYKETSRVERKPVSEVTWEEEQQTVYTERYSTEVKEENRTVYSPVVEYEYQPRMHGLLNPFVPNHIAYHLVPKTKWEARVETVRRPVTVREMAPETRIVRRPRRELKIVEQETISRVAVGPSGSAGGAASVASRESIGGVSRLENDPPRYGSSTTRR